MSCARAGGKTCLLCERPLRRHWWNLTLLGAPQTCPPPQMGQCLHIYGKKIGMEP